MGQWELGVQVMSGKRGPEASTGMQGFEGLCTEPEPHRQAHSTCLCQLSVVGYLGRLGGRTLG